MAFMIGRNLISIDSFQFMRQSLSDLANNLPKDGFYHTKKQFGTENLELRIRKGVPMIIWMILTHLKKKGYHQ